ncbi:MAG: hypothetical protein ACRC8Y_16360 [Chroococcales cyanobacterium]
MSRVQLRERQQVVTTSKENDSKSLLRTKIRERQQVVTTNEDKRTTASRYYLSTKDIRPMTNDQ